MDITYLILFINFFLQSYVLGGGKSKYRATEKSAKNGVTKNGVAHNGVAQNGVTHKKHE